MKAHFSLTEIESIKRELADLLPNVKSSHRVEAMARGLGWNTNAALRAELALADMERAVDEGAFADYLGSHGFHGVDGGVLSEAVTRHKFAEERAAIQRVMEREPNLAKWGFGVHDEPAKPRAVREAEFQSNRQAMLNPRAIGEFVRAREFLSQFGQRKSINRKISSYGLKHRAEEFHRDNGSDDPYVGNGMLIAAAVHLGFRTARTGINANLNIGAKGSNRSTPSTHVPQAALGPKPRFQAWRNMMVAAINAGLDQNLFGLDADDNRWTGGKAVYRFTLADMPAIASVGDASFGELVFKVALQPCSDAEKFIEPCTGPDIRFEAGEAFASGWLERRKGKWLQTGPRPMCYFRRELLPTIAGIEVQPHGYSPEGRIML